jgi:hypothetical protein
MGAAGTRIKKEKKKDLQTVDEDMRISDVAIENHGL